MKSKWAKQRFFLDTNIIIYCFDSRAPKKRKMSNELVASGLATGLGIVSHQVIQEFVSVACSKFRNAFSENDLILYLDEVLFTLWKAYPSREMFITALEIQKNYRLSWWDSLLIAAALETGCDILFSEDLQHEMQIKKLKIVNPFAA